MGSNAIRFVVADFIAPTTWTSLVSESLRTIGRVPPDGRFTILQGHHMGRPSRLLVDLDAGNDRVRVSGTAGPVY